VTTGFPAALMIAAVAVVAGCGPRRAPTDVPAPGPGWIEQGEASWYGSKYHGHRTASGERYDMHAMTAAHPTLPFGTVVEVVNLRNGLSVRVRINDRGPFRKGRIIDLSYGAARKLGMVRDGVAPVRVRVVS